MSHLCVRRCGLGRPLETLRTEGQSLASPQLLAAEIGGRVAKPDLVVPRYIGVEEADGDAFDMAAAEHLDLVAGLIRVETEEHAAGGEQTLGNPVP